MNTTILKKWLIISAALFSLAVVSKASANEAPDVLIKRLSQEIMTTAKNDKDIRGGNPKKIFAMVEQKVFPYVDFQRTTALAAGKHWRAATPSQREQLTKEFKDLLIYTYSGAVSQINNYKFQFRPFKADPLATDVIVQSRLVPLKGGEPIEISYRLEKQSDNAWKIYDMSVLNAWLVETYRGNFTGEISRSGMDGLIRSLAEKNRQLAKTPAKQ